LLELRDGFTELTQHACHGRKRGLRPAVEQLRLEIDKQVLGLLDVGLNRTEVSKGAGQLLRNAGSRAAAAGAGRDDDSYLNLNGRELLAHTLDLGYRVAELLQHVGQLGGQCRRGAADLRDSEV